MDMKSLVYRRTLPSQPVQHTQQQLLVDSVKSLVYSRIEHSSSSQLEGTSFESKFRRFPTAASAGSALERISSRNSSLRWARGAEHLGMNDVPKELLRAINMDDFPERLSDSAGGLGNMPELTKLLENDEVIKKFSDPTTAKYLREISMDPSVIDKYKSTPEVKYMIDKIEECRKKLHAKGLMPSQPSPAASQPFPMQFDMRNH